ncbi:hypothetical protein BCR44DRAFT_1433822, partial [Catenaria anguillulae PL171]
MRARRNGSDACRLGPAGFVHFGGNAFGIADNTSVCLANGRRSRGCVSAWAGWYVHFGGACSNRCVGGVQVAANACRSGAGHVPQRIGVGCF